MPKERFFIPLSLKKGDEVEISKEEFHHLTHVMRIREQSKIELVNGKGQLGFATVETIKKKKVLLRIDELTQKKEKSPK